MKNNFSYIALGALFTLGLFSIWAFKPAATNDSVAYELLQFGRY